MSATIDDLVDQMPAADQVRMLTKLARKVMAEKGDAGPVSMALGDELPAVFLLRCPPMPDSGPYTDADRAEDARRLANRDDTVTVDELISLIDFGGNPNLPAQS